MVRGVDHIVLAVADLDMARDLFTSLGFTVTPTAFHPFGTKNALVQLDGAYLELLAVDDENQIPVATKGCFSFPRFNLNFLTRRQGASMMVLRSEDAVGDIADFKALGLETYPQFDFERDARQPDGSSKRLSFSNGFLSHPLMKETGFFVCQHKHDPASFWHAIYQQHVNGVKDLLSIVFVAENPSDHHEFLGGFTGQREMRSTSAGVEMAIRNGTVDILTPAAAKAFFNLDVPGDMAEEGGILALKLGADLEAFTSILERSGIAWSVHHGDIVIQPDALCGVGLIVSNSPE
ncbi:VOC family protein [uncultured Cohaesibacter sp.]|uniref:VOC family protein n=1 Tax=uncultured Cohaesibacter sp. TaxID=1002546 RepID=UPI00292FEF10|nr:VOC family protein [uncultured Cohaesibacter sp.]